MRFAIPVLLAVAVGAAAADPPPADPPLPICGLPPARVVPDLCSYHYPVGSTSAECQKFFDQGSAYYQSYVWMEAARSFETATRKDPECILAWWGLSRALEKMGGHGVGNRALTKAQALLPKASPRDRLLVTARLQETGLVPSIAEAERRKAAARTLDELLALYDDDEEAWFYRAQLADSPANVPYYKALLLVNRLHPGANHELIHFYEGLERPALGWIYAENYTRSSPGIPHAFHMQAHLATRLGRWDRTSDLSARAIELERAYHKSMNVQPTDDHQYPHHLEILTRSLVHDGRFAEAQKIEEEGRASNFQQWGPWFRLHFAAGDWTAALNVAEEQRKKDKLTASYMSALVYLRQGNPDRAAVEIEVLRQGLRTAKNRGQVRAHLWEAQGLLLCQTGAPDAGLKLLLATVAEAKDDYWHHAWGGGAYEMEVWGMAALHAGRDETAEEAFLEALAHDPGSARAALGMWVLCDRLGRDGEARRYEEMARRAWRKADPDVLERELTWLRRGHTAAVIESGRTGP